RFLRTKRLTFSEHQQPLLKLAALRVEIDGHGIDSSPEVQVVREEKLLICIPEQVLDDTHGVRVLLASCNPFILLGAFFVLRALPLVEYFRCLLGCVVVVVVSKDRWLAHIQCSPRALDEMWGC